MPLVAKGGHALGTLCVIDRVPRELTEDQKAKLRALAQGVLLLLEVRRSGASA
jgi:GAF domain-containing protein